MKLEMFDFIQEVVDHMNDMSKELDIGCKDIEDYFKNILSEDSDCLNINSRVKSISSLKEKILRNNYYKKYDKPISLIYNLSDLIGIRIECRFVEDENNIYKFLKKHFVVYDENGYYHSEYNENIKLELDSKQPQEQKNGFEIYRIDGLYTYDNKTINFELQIKSIVNIFWGEVEHKVIYKNNNYVMVDGFFREMMASIKKNLSMIDNQLLIMYNQLNKSDTTNPEVRKLQVQTLLSKTIYDMFSMKMRNSIGFVIDFRKSCDTIMNYIFRSNNAEMLADYTNVMVNTLSRLNDIAKYEVDFNKKIEFERRLRFKDEFSKTMGKFILNSINKDFNWNLFFRILFEIEIGNNAEDFESFMTFFKNRFKENKSFSKLYNLFKEEEAKAVEEDILNQIAHTFEKVDSIVFIYDYNIEKINKSIKKVVKSIVNNIMSYDEWEFLKGIYLELFNLKILSCFDYKIDNTEIKELMNKIHKTCPEKQMQTEVLGYISKLDILSKKSIEEIIVLFEV